MKSISLLLSAFCAAAAFGAGCPEAIDWSAAKEFAPGMRSLHIVCHLRQHIRKPCIHVRFCIAER